MEDSGRHHICDLASYPSVAEEDGGEEDARTKRKRLLEEMDQVITDSSPKMQEWEKEVNKDTEALKIGNTNVAAHGVRLQIGDLAWGVMLNLSEIIDACYPEPSKMPVLHFYLHFDATSHGRATDLLPTPTYPRGLA